VPKGAVDKRSKARKLTVIAACPLTGRVKERMSAFGAEADIPDRLAEVR